jgi:hypothetical protein
MASVINLINLLIHLATGIQNEATGKFRMEMEYKYKNEDEIISLSMKQLA